MRNIGAALCAVALVGCGHHRHGDACKGANDAHVAIVRVDDNSAYMKNVVEGVGTTQPDGVRVLADKWHTPSEGVVIDHALEAPSRDALVHYVASLPPVPPGHRIVYAREADGAWRTLYVETSPVVGGDEFASGAIDGQGVRIELTRGGGKAFARATTEAVGHKLAVVVGDEAVAAPVVLDPIRGGALEITSPDPSGDHALLKRIGCAP
jgi:preprotein translocase subunit SecD